MRVPIRILGIEPDPDDLTILELALALDPSVEMRLASSPEQGLAILETARPFDVVLLADSFPPGRLKFLLDRAQLPDGSPPTPVILMIGGSLQRDTADGRVLATIQKPFDPTILHSWVRKTLNLATGEHLTAR